MFHLSYTRPYDEPVDTLKLKRDPFKYGLGNYEDVDGRLWDIYSMYGGSFAPNGKNYVCARQICGQLYYSTATYGTSNGFHQWIPYFVEVIEDGRAQSSTQSST
jgi:hypothetical protein